MFTGMIDAAAGKKGWLKKNIFFLPNHLTKPCIFL